MAILYHNRLWQLKSSVYGSYYLNKYKATEYNYYCNGVFMCFDD